MHIPRQDQEYAVDVGLRMLMLRHLVSLEDGVVSGQPEGDSAAGFYANAIAHLLPVSERCCAPQRRVPAI